MSDITGPQPGPQTEFCSTPVTFAITGGSFFGGKTTSLVMESARNVDHPNYRGVIFRRTFPQITDAGGLVDVASELYPQYGGVPKKEGTLWVFPSGARIKFNHLQHESDIKNYRSSQFCFLGFDQVEEFSEESVFYLSTRNRPSPGYDRPAYRRATCNPEPGWLADMLQWWWNPETGYAIRERSGVIKYFTKIDGKIVWVDKDWRNGNIRPVSFTFIPSLASDNKKGLEVNPDYESNVSTLDHVSVERYLRGNWKISEAGNMFDPKWFKKIPYNQVPKDVRKIRYWDFAASEVTPGKDPDWTAGSLLGESGGEIYIINIKKFREKPGTTLTKVKENAEFDGRDTSIRWEEEKGSAGKFNSVQMSKLLLGYDAQPDQITGDKVERAKPLSAAAQAGRVHIVDAPWNDEFLSEASSFPLKTRDQIDSVDGALKCLMLDKKVWQHYYHSKSKKYTINWKSASEFGVVYGAYVQHRDGSVYLLCALWDKIENVLFVYDARKHPNTNTELLIIESVGLLNMQTKHKHIYLGNEIITDADQSSRSTAKLLESEFKKHRIGMHIRRPTLYEEYGSIAYCDNMFISDRIYVHSKLEEVSAQFSGWIYEKNKPKEGFGYCECLLLISSEIKTEMREQAKTKVKTDYHNKAKPAAKKESWETV